MKTFISIALVLPVLILGSNAKAGHEAGFVLGTASGFSGMLDLGGGNAIDLGLAYSSNSQFTVTSDYLFTKARSWNLRNLSAPLTLYYGLGVRLLNIKSGKNDGKVAVGPRAPIGLHMEINNPNISLFAELAPVLDIVPESNVEITAGIGVRLRF
jgi:hypothetical protein